MTSAQLPLQGIRVLECTTAWAGPFTGRLLGDLGAEVIKIESRRRLDTRGAARPPAGLTLYPDNDAGEEPWNRSHRFHERNRNKLSLAMELNKPQGRDPFLRLARVSDVVIENFSPRVLPQFGLGYSDLVKVKPDLVMASLSGFGQTGPERDNVAYGPTVEQVSGLASLLGYDDGVPSSSGLFLPDVLGGTAAAGAIIAALRDRARTGTGTYIDLAEIEVIRWMTGGILLGAQAGHASSTTRLGNGHVVASPHGVFPCAGEDRWVALAVETDEQWQALAGLIGRPELATTHQSSESRRAARAEIEAAVSAWTATQDQEAVERQLRAAHVPASVVADVNQVLANEHLQARDTFSRYPIEGSHAREMSGGLWKMDGQRLGLRDRAPDLGEHNEYILRTVAGLSEDEVAELVEADVIGIIPFELEA